MEKSILENISSKYIFKNIFSFLKVQTSLKIIKVNKKLRNILEINLFHYQYYYFFILFKNVKIEKINDILDSSYFIFFPEDSKYELLWKLIVKRNLFSNENLHLELKKENIPIIQKLGEKKMDNLLIEAKEKDLLSQDKVVAYKDIIDIIKKNIDKILLKIDFDKSMNTKRIKYNNYQNIQYLEINNNNDDKPIFNLSYFNNLESLSINTFIELEEIKIIFSKNQHNNLKILKFNLPQFEYFMNKLKNIIKNIKFIFEEDKNELKDNNNFMNLRELHINEAILNQIHLKAIYLQKLTLFYIDKNYKYIKESIHKIINSYSSLTHFNICYICKSNYQFYDKNLAYTFLKECLDELFILIQNIEISLGYYYIKIIQNKNKKFTFIVKNMPIEIFESYFNQIEEIEIYWTPSCTRPNIYNLYIEENNLLSTITKIRIDCQYHDNLYIPFKSYKTLHYLQIRGNFFVNFELFSKKSSIKFPNLEYLELQENSSINVIYNLIENFKCVPNLRFLAIISRNICNCDYPYDKVIISKCLLLHKLHTLILDSDKEKKQWNILNNVEQYYSTYPELKNTNIKFCLFSNLFNK